MELTTLIICWVLVTTTAVVLAYVRMYMGLHDIMEIHLSGEGPPVDPEDIRRSSRMAKIDRIGIPITVLSALMALAILLMWAVEQAGPS